MCQTAWSTVDVYVWYHNNSTNVFVGYCCKVTLIATQLIPCSPLICIHFPF